MVENAGITTALVTMIPPLAAALIPATTRKTKLVTRVEIGLQPAPPAAVHALLQSLIAIKQLAIVALAVWFAATESSSVNIQGIPQTGPIVIL